MNIRKIEAITRDAYYEQQERDNKERKKFYIYLRKYFYIKLQERKKFYIPK